MSKLLRVLRAALIGFVIGTVLQGPANFAEPYRRLWSEFNSFAPENPTALAEAQERALSYACGAMSAYTPEWFQEVDVDECVALGAPRVRFAEIRDLISANGYYWPREWLPGATTTVWLDISLEAGLVEGSIDPHALKTLIHETVHYIDYNMNTLESVCSSERKAWHISNLFLIESGLPGYTDYGWWTRYPRCSGPDS